MITVITSIEGIVDIFEFFANDKNRDNVMYRIYEINRNFMNYKKKLLKKSYLRSLDKSIRRSF